LLPSKAVVFYRDQRADCRPHSQRQGQVTMPARFRFCRSLRSDLLCAAEITLGGLHRDVAKKKLNLLQLATRGAAEAGTTSPEIMRCEFADANLTRELLDDVPDQLFGHSFTPNSASAAHPPEETAHVDTGGRGPFIQQAMHPLRNGNGPNVTGLSSQVYDRPMPFTLLEVIKGQLC
jgi:hypothetical protein